MFSINRFTRMSKTAKYSTTGLVAGAAALSLATVPGSADSGDSSQSTATKATEVPTAFTGKVDHSQTQQDGIAQQVDAVKQAQQKAAAKKAAAKQEAAEKAAAAKAEKDRDEKQAASRAAERSKIKKSAKPNYPNNLDGWIREARSIMKKEGIPGSYEGIHRNIMRESGGDPKAQNNWDINAQNGVPSKGLLQTIKPTFDTYHVKGTPKNMTDPVANIVAACNYAADRYGSMDNVDSAY